MNIIKTLLFLFYILFRIIHNHVTANVTEYTANYDIIPFVNERLKININKLFYSLKIQKKFSQCYKTKLLLIMYDNLNNAIEFNWNIYSKIKNSVAVADYVKNNYFYKLVTDVLKTIEIEQNNSTKGIIINSTSTKDENDDTAINDKRNTNNVSTQKEATLDKLLYKINKITAEDLIYHPINKTYLEIDKNKRYKIFRRKNFDLKTWDPNEYSNDRLSMTRRMARAELAKIYPFVVSIHVMDKFTCTGSIISKNAVLTAASCLPFSYNTKMIQQMPDIIQVRIGSDYANHYGEKVPIVDVEFHPKYESSTLKNNIAIIRMTKLQKYARSRPKIRKIRLDRTADGGLRKDLRHVQILGFGAGNEDLKVDSQQLVAVNLDLMPLKQCKKIYSGQFVNELNFCAGFRASRRNSHCNGDVGAPGVAGGYLVGIVSFGPPVCGRRDAPTVFTKTGSFNRWIDQVVNEKFKIPHPGENSGSREFRSTRLFLEEDQDSFTSVGSLRSTSQTPSQHAKRHHVFKEIKSILTHMSNPTDHHRYTRNPPKTAVEHDINGEDDPLEWVNEGTKPNSAIHHPLINKSMVPIPGIHYPIVSTTYKTTTKPTRPDIGLPSNLPYEYIVEHIKTSSELDFYLQLILKDFGKDPMKLPGQKRVRPLAGVFTKPWYEDNPKESKANVKKSLKSKMARIWKNMKNHKKNQNNINLQLRKNARIYKGTLKPPENNIFGSYGNGKIIGHDVTRPSDTLLQFFDW